MARAKHKRDSAVALGALTGSLLSSSCCILQLVLNYTSVGCAGFSVLTPYRHYFRAITGGLVTYLLYSQGINRRTLTTVLLCAGFMVSQDLVSAHNKGQLKQQVQQLIQLLRVQRHGAKHQQQQQQQQLAACRTKLQVKGMRCEGCAARLRGNIADVHGVDGCTVAFTEALVEVWSNRSTPAAVSALVQAVKDTDSSYDVDVLSIECFDRSGQQQPCPADVASVQGGVQESTVRDDPQVSFQTEL